MYDPTFHAQTLKRMLHKSDFARDKTLADPIRQAAVFQEAVAVARAGFTSPLRVQCNFIREKSVYQFTHLSDQLVLRLIARNVQRLTGVRQSNRDFIIRSIRAILSEGIDYRVYKMDVRSFYETVSVEALLSKLAADAGFPRDSLRLLRSLFAATQQDHIIGLPRGIALSAVLSEYVMRSFDDVLRNWPGVYFYSRFVDDILVLTTAQEDQRKFLKEVRRQLFPGLFLNPSKTRWIDFRGNVTKAAPALAGSFDFLGYSFGIFQRQRTKDREGIFRDVTLDMSEKKASKIKTRIVKAVQKFLLDGNFSDFVDRMKLLSGNCNLFDRTKLVRRNSGLYCNYRLIDAKQSDALPALDRFYRGLILSRTGPHGLALALKLSKSQRRMLLKIGFKRSYETHVFYHFRPDRLHQLMSCWAHA